MLIHLTKHVLLEEISLKFFDKSCIIIINLLQSILGIYKYCIIKQK